jgi:FtsH-binding integral membrane protein
MPFIIPARNAPLALSRSSEAGVYALFAVAMGLTAAGVYLGTQYAALLLTSGAFIAATIAELAIIFTAGWWSRSSPLNMLLFGLFPLLSGITVTPYILMLLAQYANGAAILFNAVLTTAFLSLAAAVFAKTTSWNLSGLARGLFFGLLGLILFAVLQIFVPALRSSGIELIVSGAGIVLFALFTAYDIQRQEALARAGASPFILAIHLYLDIFNLFLMILRFMTALSGERRSSW